MDYSSVFAVSNPEKRNHNPQQLLYQHHPQQVIFQQQHSIPINQQLFQHQNQFQAFQHQQQERLHQQGQVPNPFSTVNFKLGLNANNGTKESALNGEEGDLLCGNEHHVLESRPHSLTMPLGWQPHQGSATEEPFWKPLSSNQRQRYEDNEEEVPLRDKNKYYKPSQQVNENESCKNLGNKYTHFGELEAIYRLAKIGQTNQTGSGSALTGEDSPMNVGLEMPFINPLTDHVGAIGVDHGSENSIGEEALLRKIRKRKRKRKMKDQLGLVTMFFEGLVKQVMEHQEGLHRKFLEVIERIDEERTEREAAWRSQETANHNREAIARAHEQALAASREAPIDSYIEKITGQSMNLPTRTTPLLLQQETTKEPIKELEPLKIDTSTRWPKAEVEALIQVRSSLESRFQEQGLKGPLWEEISSSMAFMGYHRSARRCKEKWENINKYFKKTKDSESARKRPQKSKTCSYFDQLDQLYSRSLINCPSASSSFCSKPLDTSGVAVQRKGYSELLEVFIAGKELGITQNFSSASLNVSEVGSYKLDFNGISDENIELKQGSHEKEKENHNLYEDSEGDHEEEEEEEGNSR